ncbi:casein kinase 2 regulatory subunit [Scheffersomyces spartinae]|uniref:Casein kinase II subunit beta n=1 Tax=Scheffersomyces spartinae TaxID=45513 RepID=A0A9P7VAR6_9ASCO|nr:casein kinase 2 regulatory subunit [Scheffersomyces spartinae]KAG7194509.1 casein kinase 2 regulatory subunit [Scheffersomyces spartinae]
MASEGEEDYVPWIRQFCKLFGHDYFVAVSHEFIEDDFNLTGLSSQVPYYKEALYTLLDYQVDTIEDVKNGGDSNNKNNNNTKPGKPKHELPNRVILDSSAELLYGLIHARYIVTKAGLTEMAGKFERNEFGSCPRYYCDSMHLIPVGPLDISGQETVRLYCPCCNDTYVPQSLRFLNIDGAFFGTTFPGLLVQMFPEIENQCRIRLNKYKNEEFGLRLFGFRINEKSMSGPRVKWLRAVPETADEIAEYDKCELRLPWGEGDDADEEIEDDEEDDDDKTMASE